MSQKLSVVPPPPYNPEDMIVYNEEFLASLSDGELAACLIETIADCGEEDETTKRLNGEVERRGLTHKQISELYFAGSTDR